MPRKAKRPCSYPGCPRLVPVDGPRFCPEHQRQEWARQNDNRPSAEARGYGPQWRAISTRFLRDYPRCQRCGAPATIAHHIIRKRDGGTDDYSNLMALCQSCHSKIHADAGEFFGGST